MGFLLTSYIKFSITTAKAISIWSEEIIMFLCFDWDYFLTLWVGKLEFCENFLDFTTFSQNFTTVPGLEVIFPNFKDFPMITGTLDFSISKIWTYLFQVADERPDSFKEKQCSVRWFIFGELWKYLGTSHIFIFLHFRLNTTYDLINDDLKWRGSINGFNICYVTSTARCLIDQRGRCRDGGTISSDFIRCNTPYLNCV